MNSSTTPAGQSVSVQNNSPWAGSQPYLMDVMGEAQNLYRGFTPQFYPNSTVAPFSAQTEQSLQAMQNRAQAGSPLTSAAQGQLQSTIRGDFLGQQNPYMDQIQTAMYNRINPQISSRFAASNRSGSGAHQEATTRAIADATAPYMFQTYGQERANQLAATQAAPALANQDYFDINQLGMAGAMRDQQSQAQLADSIARFNFGQTQPIEKLRNYAATVGGMPQFTSTQTAQPIYQNTAAQMLGGGLTAAMTARMLTPENQAVANPWLWAGGGALLGAM